MLFHSAVRSAPRDQRPHVAVRESRRPAGEQADLGHQEAVSFFLFLFLNHDHVLVSSVLVIVL